ncbi:hypothetical protein P171DRAFT_487940 [Karstenula rhodostoma CBS 690.94]|uniref:F-box domain-containing protein n=1 Tax=Karstenula rhodostoma CBS 690.94 TaxID=1392251 RepID=A0A9P4PEB4_9PLEO|nr:hypothetical protein P171DRAFT_487940 [Karstenula rhodostoma CBS 690.94]
MPTSFLHLPSEIRNDIYEQLLVLEDTIPCLETPWKITSPTGAITTGLLLANKTVSREAISILYAQNHFNFTDCDLNRISSFIHKIGQDNANFIRHIVLDFPSFSSLDLHHFALHDESTRILDTIRERCSNLRTMTTSLYSTSDMVVELDDLDCPKTVTEAFTLVDSRFRAFSALEKVIVEVYKDGASDYIRKEMEKIGWTVSETEQLVELGVEFDFDWDGNLGDSDGDYSLEDYGYDDEYDIDNDSDFWRRAGD